MRPRISGGALKGRSLAVPVPASARPTSARVREAMFSIVGHDLTGLVVLDAFSGSGLLALEAASRGAQAIAVERDRRAVRAIRTSVEALGADVQVLAGPLARVVEGLEPVDGALADPPYADDPGVALAPLWPLVRDWILLEAEAGSPPPEAATGWRLERSRRYGGTALHLFRR